MKSSKPSIHIIALSSLGQGLSGGDRIYIELARNWSKDRLVELYVWEEGLLMCERQSLEGKYLNINLIKVGSIKKLGFITTYLYRIFLGIILGFKLKLYNNELIFSASEFAMDCLPAFIAKLRNANIRWIAAWYQTAPNPLRGFSEGSREKTYRFSALLYWIAQQSIKPVISRFANFVMVNNELERRQFPKLAKDNIIVVFGGVKVEEIIEYQRRHPKVKRPKYLAVFQGRFHPQKGVEELIEIWKLVVDQIPNAKLAMIGDGPLMIDVKKKIRDLELSKNIDLLGYLYDGNKKYDVFNNSKIVVHPAFYDSGGMAAAEAMVFGLPCVGFDLKSYESYYPKGMLKVSIGDKKAFSEAIIKLVNNKNLYQTLASEGSKMILDKWSWDKKSQEI